PEETGCLDGLFEFCVGGLGVILGGTMFLEDLSGNNVDALIGALGGENGGDKEFERVGVVQFAMRIRVGFFQAGDDLFNASGFGGVRFTGHNSWNYLAGTGGTALLIAPGGAYAGALVPSTLVLRAGLGRIESSLPSHQQRARAIRMIKIRESFQGFFFSANGSTRSR